MEQRLVTFQNERSNERSSGPGFAIGRRTFLGEAVPAEGCLVEPRYEPAQHAIVHRFDAPIAAAVSITKGLAGTLVIDLWAGSDEHRRASTPVVRVATPSVDFPSDSASTVTFVCVTGGQEGYQLLPCPYVPGGPAVLDVEGDERRLRPGLPVFQRGNLVGLTLRSRERGSVKFYPIERVARDLGLAHLEGRDWARIARRLKEETLQAQVEQVNQQAFVETNLAPGELMRAVFDSRSRSLLQFVLDQAVRRLEAREPEREPGPRMRADFVLDNAGLPRSDAVAGGTAPLFDPLLSGGHRPDPGVRGGDLHARRRELRPKDQDRTGFERRLPPRARPLRRLRGGRRAPGQAEARAARPPMRAARRRVLDRGARRGRAHRGCD